MPAFALKHKGHLLLILWKKNVEDHILFTFILGKFQQLLQEQN